MRIQQAVLFAGAATIALATPAFAQDASQPGFEADDGSAIIVTARRKDESIQDVPQTVNAVSSETIQKLRINNAADIAQIVPGISIEGSTSTSGGFGSSSSVRGVPTFLTSNANPIVQFYLNDAPTGRGPTISQSLFDIGQIEVLKGPQGTLRGRAAPTGAITITSKRPDLDEVGGYVNLSGTHRGNVNLQAAIGLPIIQDVLALRVAALVDHSDGSGVTSANFRAEPYSRSEAVRATLRFEPSPTFNATVMYQRLWTRSQSFTQVFGPGNGANGPAIAAGDRLGITDRPGQNTSKTHFVTGQFEWRFAGQKLSYVGSYSKGRSTARSTQDTANVLPGIEYYQDTETPGWETSHELRLSSDERIADIFDYVVGVFYDKDVSNNKVDGNAQFLSGAFGRPGTLPVVQAPLARYTLRNTITVDPVAIEKSAFANVTAHLGPNTEFSAGGRFIEFKRHDRFVLGLVGAYNAISNPTGGRTPCNEIGLVNSPVYTGICDVPIASSLLQNVDRRETFKPFIYNFSLSHKFSPDFMAYANYGTAFRSAGPAIGVTSVLACCAQAGGPNLGSMEDLIFQGEEKSRTAEIGFKSTFFDRRARLNVALFYQKFDNFFFLTQPTRYLGVSNPATPAAGTINSFEFTTGADAKVRGIDVEAGFQVTPRWNVNVGFTWSKATLDNALIPCNDGNFDGKVDSIVPTAQDFINAGVLVARCRSNEAISRTPRWNVNLQSEYSAPLSGSTDGFVRGNFNYFPDNPNASQGIVIDKYSLLNLYAGIRDADNAWEVSLFVNNLLNTRQVLSVNPVAQVSNAGAGAFFGNRASGYQAVNYTPRREFGLQVRYAFGSR